MLHRLILLSIAFLFFLFPTTSFGYDLDTFTGRNITGGYYLDHWNGTSDFGYFRTGYYAPSEELYIRELETILCVSATTTYQIRAEIYWMDGGVNGTPTLVGYSDWLNDDLRVVTGATNCDKDLDLVTFSFGTAQQLHAGYEYLITFPTYPNLLDLYGSGGGTFSFVKSVYFATSSGLTTLDEIVGVTRYDVEDYDNTDTWRPTSFNSIYLASYLPAIRTSGFVSGTTSENYLSINEIGVTVDANGSSTRSAFACSHTSDSSSYYTYCPVLITSTTTVSMVDFLGIYSSPDLNFWIENWILDSRSRPIADVNTMIAPDAGASSGFYSNYWILRPDLVQVTASTSYTINVRNSLISADYAYPSATAQITIVFCTDVEECEDGFYTFTQTGDGITVGIRGDEEGALFSEDRFTALFENVKTFGAFGFWIPFQTTLLGVLEDQMLNGTSSTSTVTTFDIPLDMSAFGLPATDAHLPVSAMLAKADDLSPNLFIYIDYFLWGLFWLFILSRILSGAWNVLPNRDSRDSQMTRFNQNRFAGDLGKTLHSNNVWRK